MTTSSPVVDSSRVRILNWFTGKALDNARTALDLLARSEALGYWEAGSSRKVTAALSKANVAAKLGRPCDKALRELGGYPNTDNALRGSQIGHLLIFGALGHTWAKGINYAGIKALTNDQGLQSVIDQAQRFANDFAPVAELISRLNDTRPKPAITYLGVSPTVTSLLTSLGMEGTVAVTVRVCPIRWEKIETTVDGKLHIEYVGYLEWPEGTVHGSSRYNRSEAGNRQCQACGHAIKNPYNYVPLIIDDDKGVPHSLWTGTDCCESFFGVKIKGAMDIKRGDK